MEERVRIKRETITLSLEDMSEVVGDAVVDPTQAGGPGDRFQFQLCTRNTLLGELVFDQWWMDKRGLYGERNFYSPNRQAILDLYWAICLHVGTALHDQDTQETYVLASLLPHTRSNGSRRVFVDASLTHYEHDRELKRSEYLLELKNVLEAGKHDAASALVFNRRTADILGPPVYEADVTSIYDEFTEQILHGPRQELRRHGIAGLNASLKAWQQKMRTIGRRSGHEKEKQALDMLSYECRAAFHRIYSATWTAIIEYLANERNLCDEAILFHRLWQLQQCMPSNEAECDRFFLFHGHIFGLHPAAGDMICTEPGRDLVAELILSPSDDACHRRFLNGMMLAAFFYSDKYNVAKELRKPAPGEFFIGSFETTEAMELEKQRGRFTEDNGTRESDR